MNFVRINGYPDYVIHPCGTILRLFKSKTTELKHTKRSDEYMVVGLYKNGKQKMCLVHRLLALAFIPNPENKRCVDHVRGNHMGNSLENLRWVTHQENMDGFRTNRPKAITKGCISKKGNSWQWRYYIDGKPKSKCMPSKEKLEAYRTETLK